MAQLLIGCDPEVFMYNRNSGKYVSAFGRIEGTKNHPYKVRKGAVQVDGNALEFNIDPARDEEEFVDNINTVYGQLKEMVPGYELHAVPTVQFDQEDWDKLPDKAKELGCDPDFNCYTQQENVVAQNPLEPIRHGAGHIHIGWTDGVDIADPVHIQDCIKMAKQLDWYLAPYFGIWDTNNMRRKAYGRPGSIRYKPYGVEYRYPSNVWLNSEDMIRSVYKITHKAFTDLVKGVFAPKVMFDKGYFGNDIDRQVQQSLVNYSTAANLRKYIQACDMYSGIENSLCSKVFEPLKHYNLIKPTPTQSKKKPSLAYAPGSINYIDNKMV